MGDPADVWTATSNRLILQGGETNVGVNVKDHALLLGMGQRAE